RTVRAERCRNEPSGHCCRGTPGGTTGSVAGVPGVTGRSERRALGERPLADFGSVRLAHDHRSGRTEPAHDLRVVAGGGKVSGTAECGGNSREVRVVLDSDRHAEKWGVVAVGDPLVGRCRVTDRVVGTYVSEGVDAVLVVRDPA